ncbi:MAG: class F sortase [Pseudonocardiales bacterium]
MRHRSAHLISLCAAGAALMVGGCSAESPAARAGAGASASTAPSSSPSAGLLGSHSATLAAARAEAARRPVAVQVPGYPGFSPVQAFTADPVTRGLDLPKNARTVAWWGGGTMPGEPSGTAVLAAHVSYQGSKGPFTHLRSLPAGAIVRVRRADGSVRAFRLVGRRELVKSALGQQDLFRATGPAQLALITCGGTFNAATRNYSDNVIVYAVPVA